MPYTLAPAQELICRPFSPSMDTETQHTQTIHTNHPNDDMSELHPPSKECAMLGDSEEGLAENMSKPLEQIFDVPPGSTFLEGNSKYIHSKSWGTHKKASNNYDDDFLERASDDIGIILTSAGLFSAVNSMFIIEMQPNPLDITSVLTTLGQTTANGLNAANHLAPTISSSTVWMRMLAFASLVFSSLATLGAIAGKQWLDSYEIALGRVTSKECCLQRKRKLQAALRASPALLQISLVLLDFSLSINIWTRDITVLTVTALTTAFGVVFYLSTVLSDMQGRASGRDTQ